MSSSPHNHECLGCGYHIITTVGYGCSLDQCDTPTASVICEVCLLNHNWMSNLRIMAHMLTGIKLPHSIGECNECGKARLMQIKYQEESQIQEPHELVADDLKEIIVGAVGRMTYYDN